MLENSLPRSVFGRGLATSRQRSTFSGSVAGVWRPSRLNPTSGDTVPDGIIRSGAAGGCRYCAGIHKSYVCLQKIQESTTIPLRCCSCVDRHTAHLHASAPRSLNLIGIQHLNTLTKATLESWSAVLLPLNTPPGHRGYLLCFIVRSYWGHPPLLPQPRPPPPQCLASSLPHYPGHSLLDLQYQPPVSLL